MHSGPEPERHHFDAVPPERDLYETYLPHFEAAVRGLKLDPDNAKDPVIETLSASTALIYIRGTEKDAEELAALISGVKSVVNLIPYNPVEGKPFNAPPQCVCETFQAALTARGVATTLRQERGQDIDAACGQLRLKYEKK